MSDGKPNSSRLWPLPLLVALVALAAIVLTLDSNGAVPGLSEGPGLTLDETFNVQMGVYHVWAIRTYGLALFHPDSVREVFDNPSYNPDHPPFGRLWIGIAHALARPWLHPDVPAGSVCVTCGRIASACSFALTIFLVGWMTSRWYGRAAGLIAAISLPLMPRLFAHAHLAALETFVNLTYVGTVLFVADRWSTPRRPAWRHILVGGLLFGLCLLTKIQAVLLPVPVVVWSLWRWRLRAILPLVAFGLAGLIVFFAGWPWLWLDPQTRFVDYFASATDRQTLYCWYLDHKWADVDVPWHYAPVMFAVTVPVGLQLLGVMGLVSRSAGRESADSQESSVHNPRSMFLLLNVVWPLVFFALPGITVYDGTRLFLMVFPLWAIVVGCGGAALYEWVTMRTSRVVAAMVVGLIVAAQAVGVTTMHPLGLSYYNLLVGGLSGASRGGFELTYWGDSLTAGFLNDVASRLPEGAVVHVAPVLHPFQLEELISQSPALRQRNIELRAYDDQSGEDVQYVLVFRRRADAWGSLTPAPDGELIAEVARSGVQLAALYRLD